ncbi:hypothetical protein [Pseudoalteromonas sp. Of7M-16]|uniref:hypothetical protein n=1 Tax=Pseudoalteromonas sp. Of7M-16 TaxID=2917756 RepID=UPI001EF5E383|nr:hypothetical protein [Pseudoalteromonas sp. Of7M-16]MCG7551783.1 hypothetical protein [Pseudoalteromonas sp. Of7M-16]
MNENKTKQELAEIEAVLKAFGLKRVLNEKGHRVFSLHGAENISIAVDLNWDKYGDTPLVSIGIVDNDVAQAMNILTGIPIKLVQNRLSFGIACQASSINEGKFGVTEDLQETITRLKSWLTYIKSNSESIVNDYIHSVELYKLPTFFTDCALSFGDRDTYWLTADLYLISLKKKIANNTLTAPSFEDTLHSAKENGYDIESNYELGLIKSYVCKNI